MEQLGDRQVGDLVVDRRPEEDDPLAEQTRVDVEGALAVHGLLDHHRNLRAHRCSLLLWLQALVYVIHHGLDPRHVSARWIGSGTAIAAAIEPLQRSPSLPSSLFSGHSVPDAVRAAELETRSPLWLSEKSRKATTGSLALEARPGRLPPIS